ncbi:MAG TPA: hypothetical protein VF069_19540 [Streptosporangiaceae bacterium]
MTAGDRLDPRRPGPANPEIPSRLYGSPAARHSRPAEGRLSAEEVVQKWDNIAKSFSRRPYITPAGPAASLECLCGEPADFVVETNWFNGRRSQDPVCERHVDEVIRAIRKEQARRNGV